MAEKEYKRQLEYGVIEEEPEVQLYDPRTYCFNVSSKGGDVCLPKSCHVVKKALESRTVETEEPETTLEGTKLIPLKQQTTTCIPWKETENLPFKPGQSNQTGKKEYNIQKAGRDDPENIIYEIPVVGELSAESEGNTMSLQERSGQPKSGFTGVKTRKGGEVHSVGMGMTASKSGVPGMQKPIGIMGLSGARVTPSGKDISSTSAQVDREKASLAKLMGIAQGPAAILASFGNIETAKESLASIGAMSVGGAIVCECCECQPCICGPRGLNLENIVSALKTMMHSGEDLNKLITALGPGAMTALETIMAKEGDAAAGWATGGGMSKDHLQSEDAKLDGTSTISPVPIVTDSQRAFREAWLRGDFDEMTSCHCLPGMCPCPGGHYVYKEKKSMDRKDIEKRKKTRRIRKRVKKIGKDGKEYEEWDWVTPSESDSVSRLSETCVCPPTKHFLTPASSEADVTGRPIDANKRMYWGDWMVCSCPRLQRTLVIIKPECIKFKDVVLRAVRSYGLDILAERQVHLSPEEASEIYAKYYGTSRFPNMVVSISQAPVIALSLGGIDVVKIWNHIIGPDGTLPGEWFLPNWIMRKFGYYGEIVDALHGSKNLVSAERENRYFFPESFIDPLMMNETHVKEYITTNVNPTLLKGLTLLAKKKPIDPILFLAEWLLTNNPFQPHFPINVSLASV